MKNKLIINIVLVYFILLAIVLVVQMRLSGRDDISTEPLRDNMTYSHILSQSIVLCDRSPVMLVNQKQLPVNTDNAAAVPTVDEGQVMVPVEFFENAYGAVVSWDKDRENATVRLDNKALVVDNKGVTLVSASEERELTDTPLLEFKNGCAYIPLNSFAEGFNKELSIYGSVALLSDTEPELKEEEVAEFETAIASQLKNLPSVDEQSKLEELLGSGAVNIFNTIGESMGMGMGIDKTESPVTSLGLDSLEADGPGMVKTDGEYLYFVRDKSLCIAHMGEKPETISITSTDAEEIYGIYVNGRYLTLVGRGTTEPTGEDDAGFDGCILTLYDTSDKSLPVKVRQVAAEGDYRQAHKKGDTLYLFVTKEARPEDSYALPGYYDSSNSNVAQERSLSLVRYVPEMADKAYTSVVCFNTGDSARAVNIHTLLGCGDNLSLTGDSLYIAAPATKGTSLYRLALTDGNMTYASAAYLEGNVPDRGCINELKGTLRVAASTDEDTANITLLDERMEVTDALTGINPGGRLVSSRFIGTRGYLVTDHITSPVFAVDLGENIQELGTITIPSGTEAVRNYDAEHFVCIKEDGSISMLNISGIPYEAFTTYTGGDIAQAKVSFNTGANILAVPVIIEEQKVTTLTEAVTEVTTGEAVSEVGTVVEGETTPATTATEVSTEATTANHYEPGSYVMVYKPDLTAGAFVPLEGINLDGDTPTDMVLSNDRLYVVTDNEVKSSYIK